MDSTNAYIAGAGLLPAEQVNLSTGQVSYMVSDRLGSVRGIVTATGTLAASTSYDAWGNAEQAAGLNSYTPFGFGGGYVDATGLIYLVNRYYDPATGQFLSIDSDVSRTLEPYGYADGNPVINMDPAGLYAVLYRPRCGHDGCVNITKRCGSDNKCMLFWAAEFTSTMARSAYAVTFNFEIKVAGIPVQGPQYYGHVEAGNYRWHGDWGIFSNHDWGYYRNLGGMTEHMGPATQVHVGAWGPVVLQGGTKAKFQGGGTWSNGVQEPWLGMYSWPALP